MNELQPPNEAASQTDDKTATTVSTTGSLPSLEEIGDRGGAASPTLRK
jgi:hypothetical protein